jgi:endo-1,4-beta-xylanase
MYLRNTRLSQLASTLLNHRTIKIYLTGFSLVELLIIVSVIAILAVVGLVVYGNTLGNTQATKKKADINAMAKAYEIHYDGSYQTLRGEWFATGVIPTPPEGGDYFNDLASGGASFRVCANLISADQCTESSTTCYCKDAIQTVYIASYTQSSYVSGYTQSSYGVASPGITFVGANSTPVGAPAPSITVSLPSGVQNQDLMVAQVAVLGNLTSTNISVPAGWNQISQTGTGGPTLVLYWKRALGETGPYTWNFTNTNTGAATNKSVGAGIVVYRNVADPAIPFETSFGIQTSTSVTAQPLTTSTANQWVVYFGMIGAGTTISAPVGYQERYGGGLIEAADTNQPIVSSGTVVGPITGIAGASGINIGQLLALRPSSSPAPLAPIWPAIPLGAAIDPAYFNEPLYVSSILTKGFNSISPSNGFFMQNLEPTTQGQFDFKTSDLVANFARTYHKKLHATPFFWDNLLPTWFNNSTNFTSNSTTYTQAQLVSIRDSYLTVVGNRYKDIANAWVIVNEAAKDDGLGLRQCGLAIASSSTPMPWACINPITAAPSGTTWTQCTPGSPCNWIDQSFLKARDVLGPNVKLCYNDYNAEDLGSKSNYIYGMVQSMKARNIPIDCVGLQSHINSTGFPTYANVKANIQRLNALGVDVRITEIDVKVGTATPNATQLNQQASAFGTFAAACKDSPNCTEFTTWGVGDLHSWLNTPPDPPYEEAPLLLDASYNNKPAYDMLGF